MDNIENRVQRLEDSISGMSKVLDKMGMLLENQQKESERHHKKMEEIMSSQQNFNKFIEMTNYKIEEMKNNTGCQKDMKMLREKVDDNASKIKTLKDYYAKSTNEGCSALKLAISDDKLDKADMVNVKKEIKGINDNLKWVTRAVIGTVISGILGGFIGLSFYMMRSTG